MTTQEIQWLAKLDAIMQEIPDTLIITGIASIWERQQRDDPNVRGNCSLYSLKQPQKKSIENGTSETNS